MVASNPKTFFYPRYRPTWPRGVQEVEAPAAFTPRNILVLIFRSTWTFRMLRKKSPVTRPGIDPGTFRLVAQRLNHYATPKT